MQLVNGSRVVIVGGGPAGSFSALHLLRLASEAGLRLDVTIVEARDFARPGPGGCNQCAGILSSRLVRHLAELDLSLPPEVVQSELAGYRLHLGSHEVPLLRPDPDRRIVSVYRGSGPRLGSQPRPCSFDGWLLGEASARGARVLRGRVQTIQMSAQPLVITARHRLDADLVVLATGVNSRPPLERAWRYRPPRTEIMAQDEVLLPPGLDDSVHVFFGHPPGLVFGGIIPKGRYANLSLLGRRLPPDAVNDFLDGAGVLALLPSGAASLCGCTPRVAVSAARGYFTDRVVAVGDAAVTRLYKDGIGSAFLTAGAAARTAVQHGIARQDFGAHYQPVCRGLALDNLYGRLLFRLCALAIRATPVLHVWRQALEQEAELAPTERPHTRVLWGMFTGDESYQQLFRLALSRTALRGLWRSTRQRPA